jgi:hypothetical protein
MMAAGVEAEYRLDPYGLRRPEGRHQLVELDPAYAAKLLNTSPGLREVDKFFSVDTGTFLVGELLGDRRRHFRPGDQIIVQCSLTPPHEDLWVECQFQDADGHVVDRMAQTALREQFRTNFFYTVAPTQEPGDYTIVIQSAGQTVLQKRLHIAGPPTVAALP